MAINIELGKYKLTSDERQIIVHRKKLVDPTKSPKWEEMKANGASAEIKEVWIEVAYFRHIENVIRYLSDHVVLESDATTLRELHKEVTAFHREIRRAWSEVE